ncbi:MAG: hypothetical protein HFG78_13970 [Hungatella sp.]|nr:hypothetical protein [Hungatella sp.]
MCQYVFVRKGKDKTNKVTLNFQREHLSKDMFIYDEAKRHYIYEEVYKNKKSEISFVLRIMSSNFQSLFSMGCNLFKIEGNCDDFRILIETKDLSITTLYKHDISKFSRGGNIIQYGCEFKGYFDDYQLFLSDNKIFRKNVMSYDEIHKRNEEAKRSKIGQADSSSIRTVRGVLKLKTDKSKEPEKKIGIVKGCPYYKNKICVYFDDLCNPHSVKCKNSGILRTEDKRNNSNIKIGEKLNSNNKKVSTRQVNTVVLLNNRKCIYEDHSVIDINAVIRVATPLKIIKVSIPAAYCKKCNKYIILKEDFKRLKEKGVLLCEVIDRTSGKSNNSKEFYGDESRIHSLGYNVTKRQDYTYEQRKYILANMIENYDITKHEILSIIDMNIARHSKFRNHSEAVSKWREDRAFVMSYRRGDCPEVLIDSVIIGSRK